MESFLPSEIGRLIYGYLSEEDTNLAETFLNTSDVMEECRISKAKSRKFNSKVQGLTLTDILDQYSVLCSLIFRNVETVGCDHVLNLLQKILRAKIPGSDNVNDNTPLSDSTVSLEPEHSTEVTRKSDNFTQTDPETTQESMDVSSSSLNEPHVLPEPPETINLFDSENEMNTSNLNKSDMDNSIDLTSPCPLVDSPVKDSQTKSTRGKRTKVPPRKTKLVKKSEINVPKEKLIEHKTPKKADDTSHPVDNVFNKLSVNPSTRLANYVTPLKLSRKHVFGEHTSYTNNSHEKPSDDHISRIFGSALKNLDENPLEFSVTSKAPNLSSSNLQEIPTSQEMCEPSKLMPNSPSLTSGEIEQLETVKINCSEETSVLENNSNLRSSDIEPAKTSIPQTKPSSMVKTNSKSVSELLLKSPKSWPPMYGIACLNPIEPNNEEKSTDLKIPTWDMNLRQFIPEETASEKKPKRCKREARKSATTEPAAKRHKSDTTPSKCRKSNKTPIKCKKISRKNADIKDKESVPKTSMPNDSEAKKNKEFVQKSIPNSSETKKNVDTKHKVSVSKTPILSNLEAVEVKECVQPALILNSLKAIEEKISTQEAPMTIGVEAVEIASEKIEPETLNERSDYFIPKIVLEEEIVLYKAFIIDDEP